MIAAMDTASYLASLTTEELSKLSEQYGLYLPPELDRGYIIEQLLDAGAESGPEQAAGEREKPPAPLPPHYGFTFIDALVRDPLWVFVFWEIGGHQRELCDGEAEGFVLRISPASPASPDGGGEKEALTVAVEPDEGGRYVSFTLPGEQGGHRGEGQKIVIALCAVLGGKLQVLAETRPFRMPRLLDTLQAPTPLQKLSGIEEYPILRHVDRLVRPCPGRRAYG